LQEQEKSPLEQIGDELKLLFSGEQEMYGALKALGLVPGNMLFSHISAERGWIRGGGETYALPFSVHMKGENKDGKYAHELKLVFKACTPFPGPVPLLKIFDSWIARRKLLEANGVSTPVLCGAFSALVLEEYLEHHLSDVILQTNDRFSILNELGRSLGVIAKLSFNPPGSIICDLRSRGNDVVFIDFGYDLGDPQLPAQEATAMDILNRTVRDLIIWKISAQEEIDYFRAGFLRSYGRLL